MFKNLFSKIVNFIKAGIGFFKAKDISNFKSDVENPIDEMIVINQGDKVTWMNWFRGLYRIGDRRLEDKLDSSIRGRLINDVIVTSGLVGGTIVSVLSGSFRATNVCSAALIMFRIVRGVSHYRMAKVIIEA